MKQLLTIPEKIKFLLLIFIVKGFATQAQVTPTSTYPWIMVQQARVATTNPANLNNPDYSRTVIQYLDAYGKSLQTIDYMASPLKKDIISGVETLDAVGRTDKSYLPVPVSSALGQYFSNVEITAQSFYGDSKPYSKVALYEASPISRPLKVFGPGEAFQTPSSSGVQENYTVQGAGIRRYVMTDDNTINGTGSYTNGQLIRTVTKDEDGNEVIEYRGGKSGRLVQRHQKSKSSSDELLITAYVYDFIGRLRFVIPPKLYNVTTNISVSTHAEGLYIYRYDDRSRLIEIQKPGATAEYTVYNELGQVVMNQDGRHRESNTWLWIKYDGHGRVAMNGTLTSSYTRSQIQSFFDSYTANEHFEEPSTVSGNLLRYTNRSFPSAIPIAESNVKNVNYYDQYDWVNNSSLNFQLYINPRYTNVTGLATGSMVRRLDTGTWMKTVFYYDDQNRLIQTQAQNRYGVINQTDRVLDFEGHLLGERTIYRRPSNADLTVSTSYVYDHEGRRTSSTHTINGTNTPLVSYEYDEVGRLVRKSPGSTAPLQTNDYSYTIRGQLRGINLNTSGNINLSGNDLFALKLDHHETGVTFNGKLNKQTWQSRTTPAASSAPRSFTYAYDGFDRVSAATFTGVGSEDYGMPGIDYDANGNLTAFNRKGMSSPGNYESIDILAFNYTNIIGNKLQYIREWGNNSVGFTEIDFFNTNDYTYYPDGSLKSDANKGITLIEYNYLGFVDKVHFGSSKRIENVYDSEGIKLEQRLINGSTTHNIEYMGDLIYKNGVLETILHDEGRVKIEGTNRRYQFFIKDHLGSTRAIVEKIVGTTTLVQENHYGVWGETLAGLSSNSDWNFLFQGKEYIDFEGYKLYDFHTRGYDPWTGRFWQMDGANQFASGYVGMGNNPVSFVDPDGQWVHLLIGAVIGGVTNLVSNWGNINGNFWKGAGYFGIGAVAGAVGAGIGAGVNVAIAGGTFSAGFWGTASGVASTGFFSGLATGASAGFSNGFLSGTGNGLVQGNSLVSSLGSGFRTGGIQGAFGGVTGGVIGGIHARSKSLNFWNGTADLDLSSGFGAHGPVPTDGEPITGKFVGKFEGIDVYESKSLGTVNYRAERHGGITLPGRGIIVGEGAFSRGISPFVVKHEFGHILQARALGYVNFYKNIGIPSLWSASFGNSHHTLWTEVWANNLSYNYFGKPSNWPTNLFPLKYSNPTKDIIRIFRSFLH